MMRSLRSAGGALLLQATLHAQLLRLDWEEEKGRLMSMLAALLLGFLALWGLMLAAGTLLLALCWDTHMRYPVLLALIATCAAGVAWAWWWFCRFSSRSEHSFAASRSEMAADVALLAPPP